MIWCCDAKGEVNYVAPEWDGFTGQKVSEALGHGWLGMVHEEDRPEVSRIFFEACRRASTFTIQYRLRRADGGYARVVAGAAPSLSPVDGVFVGFMGALTEVSRLCHELGNTRSLGYLKLPRPVGSTMPQSRIDVISDHVLMARAAAEKAGDATLIASLDLTLSLIFVKLGGSRAAH